MADAQITVAGLTVTPGTRNNALRWTVSIGSCLPYLAVSVFEVWSATDNYFPNATKIAETTDLNFVHTGLLIGLTRYYWVRAKDSYGQFSDLYPVSFTGGVAGTPVSTGTDSVGGDELQNDSVGNEHVRFGAITADKMAVTSLSAISATLGDVAVNGNLLLNGTVSAGKYADLSILTDKLAPNAVSDVIEDTTLSPSSWSTANVPSEIPAPGSAVIRKSIVGTLANVRSGRTVPVTAYLRFSAGSGAAYNYWAYLAIIIGSNVVVLGAPRSVGQLSGSATFRGLLSGNADVPDGISSYDILLCIATDGPATLPIPVVHSSSTFRGLGFKK